MRDIRVLLDKNPELTTHFTKQGYANKQNYQIYYEYDIDSYGVEVLENKYKFNIRSARYEVKFLNELIDFCNEVGYNIIYQYTISRYRIDYYIPDLNLAIEYDENFHKRQMHKDMIRESKIKELLGCQFLHIVEEDSVGKSFGRLYSKIIKVKG